jgi:hypothetical protein
MFDVNNASLDVECSNTPIVIEDNQFQKDSPAEMPQHSDIPLGQLSVITSLLPAQMGKRFELTPTGVSKSVAAQMQHGRLDVHTFGNAADLASILKGLATHQALCAGLPKSGARSVEIYTKAELIKHPNAIARSNEFFYFPAGPGLMILDYDPHGTALEKTELMQAFENACPQIADAMRIWWSSSSSNIHFQDSIINGLSGQRLYLLVADASDIPRAGHVLLQRLWLQGHGRILVSSSGQCLLRTLADGAMFEPTRLDFAGGAICVPPLMQDRGEPDVLPGQAWLDTREALPDLDAHELERYTALVAEAKLQVEPERILARLSWSERHIKSTTERLEKAGVPRETAIIRARRSAEKALQGELPADFLIPLANGEFVSVADVLAAPQRWNGVQTLDPMEPEYDGGRMVGKLLMGRAKPVLNSFAHGGVRYHLAQAKPEIYLVPGSLWKFNQELGEALSARPDMFLYGGLLVQVVNNGYMVMTRSNLPALVSRVAVITKADAKGNPVVFDLTPQLADGFLSSLQTQNFRPLTDIATIPSIDTDGVIFDQPGYDAKSGVFFQIPEDSVTIDRSLLLNRSEIVRCLQVLWKPWSQYPFATDEDRGAMLAAILSAVCRPMLKIMPGYVFDAPVPGSGKSFAAFAINALVTGSPSRGVMGFSSNGFDTELSKQLLAIMRQGIQAIVIDNVKGFLESNVLSCRMTSEGFSGRVLGDTLWVDCPDRLFLCMTSNNASLERDLQRRLCKIRIDAAMENPQSRSFEATPTEMVLANRPEIARCAVFVIAAFKTSGAPCFDAQDCGFKDWNELVRQTVLWLELAGHVEEAGLGSIGDPAKSISTDTGRDDPNEISGNELISALFDYYGEGYFQASGLLEVMERVRELQIEDPSMISEPMRRIVDSLRQLAPRTKGEMTSAAIGQALRRFKDVPFDSLKLQVAGADRNKAHIWQVTSTSEIVE